MTQTETRIFHYDLWGHLIAETNQSGQMLAEYVYLGDQLLSMIKPGESVYYFHNDHLGTPKILTSDSQAIAWKAVYTPFGEAVPSIQTVENPFRFPGQYYDQETGLHYNYFRYYNPQTGRYITPDPIGLEGGVNLFAYVKNSPINFVDPYGLRAGHIAGGVAHGVLAPGGLGATIGAVGLGTLGGIIGAGIGGPVGGIVGGLLGGFVGGEIGALFDQLYAGELNPQENLEIQLQRLREENDKIEEFLNSPEIQERDKLLKEWNRRTGGIVDGKPCK